MTAVRAPWHTTVSMPAISPAGNPNAADSAAYCRYVTAPERTRARRAATELPPISCPIPELRPIRARTHFETASGARECPRRWARPGSVLGAEPRPLRHGDRLDFAGVSIAYGDIRQAARTSLVNGDPVVEGCLARPCSDRAIAARLYAHRPEREWCVSERRSHRARCGATRSRCR